MKDKNLINKNYITENKAFLWKIGGEAGFGIMTTGLFMSKIATRSGYRIYDYTEYPSLIRGGHNTYEVIISNEEIRASKNEVDMLVCLNKETYSRNVTRLTDKSIIIYDDKIFEKSKDSVGIWLSFPIKQILDEEKASFVMANTITLGASLALMNGDLSIFEILMQETFGAKGKNIAETNILIAKKGFNYVKDNYNSFVLDVLHKLENGDPPIVISGNEVFGLASVVADCRLYAAYPMTPATSVQTYLASVAEKTGIIVRHSEDEIAVINTALGSSYAGVRSSVGSSGGGFALMVESISYAGIAEIPIVIFLSERPGPATGIPTGTEQADLLFAVHAGHGDFFKIVLAPGDVEEMLELTLKAYDLADIYQTPVIVLSDKVLSESHKDIPYFIWKKITENYNKNRGKLVKTVNDISNYLRYKNTEDGISPCLIPATNGTYYQANSYEHSENSIGTENTEDRILEAEKRQRKMGTYLKNHYIDPKVFGDLEKSDIVFVSWGGNKGTIIESQKILESKGIISAYIHFTHVYPIKNKGLEKYLGLKKRYILIENNQSSQFGRLLKAETGYDIKEKFLKFNGQPIFVEEILNFLTKNL